MRFVYAKKDKVLVVHYNLFNSEDLKTQGRKEVTTCRNIVVVTKG